MNETPEIQRLTKAIANLVTVLVELTTARVRAELPAPKVQAEPPAPSPPVPVSAPAPKPLDNWMTKKQLAAYMNVSVRTVDNLLQQRRLPHVRLSRRCIRFLPSMVEEELKVGSLRGRF
jgi:excisionase family DNA binding protein